VELENEQIAAAFCEHHFEIAIPYLADDVTWTLVGAAEVSGKAAVEAACRATAAELSSVTTEFRRFKSVVSQDCVVIDSVGEYTDPEGKRSVVASCDIFTFGRGRIADIRSYNIELE
jgi:ketosteroid isomerase-like protein